MTIFVQRERSDAEARGARLKPSIDANSGERHRLQHTFRKGAAQTTRCRTAKLAQQLRYRSACLSWR